MKKPDREQVMQPLAVHMYLTTICNLACTHCYYDALRVGDDAGHLLDTGDVVSIIRFLADNFEADLHVEGGELFLRPDIEEILTQLTPRQLGSLTFTTSGTVPLAVAPEWLRRIGELRISVEGHEDPIQSLMRPAKLSRVRRTIDKLLADDVDFTLRVTLFRDNLPVLAEMLEAFVTWGVSRLSLFEFQAVGRGEDHADEYSLPEGGFETALESLSEMNLPAELELIKLNLSPHRVEPAEAFRARFEKRGFRYIPLTAIPNLTVNANGDLGVSPWLATAAKLGDKFANYYDVAFGEEISGRLASGHLSAYCPHTSALQIRFDRSPA